MAPAADKPAVTTIAVVSQRPRRFPPPALNRRAKRNEPPSGLREANAAAKRVLSD